MTDFWSPDDQHLVMSWPDIGHAVTRYWSCRDQSLVMWWPDVGYVAMFFCYPQVFSHFFSFLFGISPDLMYLCTVYLWCATFLYNHLSNEDEEKDIIQQHNQETNNLESQRLQSRYIETDIGRCCAGRRCWSERKQGIFACIRHCCCIYFRPGWIFSVHIRKPK